MYHIIQETLQHGRDSLINLRHAVESRTGRLFPMSSVRAACEMLVREGRVIKVGDRHQGMYELAESPAYYRQPLIADHLRSVLYSTDAPLTVDQLTQRVSILAGRRVSRSTINRLLSELRLTGHRVRSCGRAPTRYIGGAA